MRRNSSEKREKIYELISSVRDHPTADWVFTCMKKEYPQISLGTVYRNLKILVEEGRIRTIKASTGSDHFDADLQNHAHVVCKSCGHIMDIHGLIKSQVLKPIENNTGFVLSKDDIQLMGLCPTCQAKE